MVDLIWIFRFSFWAAALSFFVAFVSSASSAGNIPDGTIDYAKSGTRFEVRASVGADRSSSYATQVYADAKASLNVNFRISAHAQQEQYFGTVTGKFTDIDLSARQAKKLIWREARCHQRRGLPKITVTSIDGSIALNDRQIEVHAKERRLGMLLPPDEITPGIRLKRMDSSLAYESRTSLSHLFVDVEIDAFDCTLAADPKSK